MHTGGGSSVEACLRPWIQAVRNCDKQILIKLADSELN